MTPQQIIDEAISDYIDVGGSVWDATELAEKIIDTLEGHSYIIKHATGARDPGYEAGYRAGWAAALSQPDRG